MGSRHAVRQYSSLWHLGFQNKDIFWHTNGGNRTHFSWTDKPEKVYICLILFIFSCFYIFKPCSLRTETNSRKLPLFPQFNDKMKWKLLSRK